MSFQMRVSEFLLKEWLLITSVLALVVMSLYAKRLPLYTEHELQVLVFLAMLFVTVKGLECSGLLKRISQHFEHGRAIPVKLVLLSFFLSMLVTNDVALIVLVPLTLLLPYPRLDVLVILEALAANAGSALTPFGNPQNLYIYWHYQLAPGQFISTIAPLSAIALVLLLAATVSMKIESGGQPVIRANPVNRRAYVYLILLTLVSLAILRVLPWWSSILVVIYTGLWDRRSLRIDYALLLSFVFFFGVADQLDAVLPIGLKQPTSIFLSSALISQVISNVPATLVLAKVTDQWPALLWGSNIGGFGSLIGSLANVIAYRLYLRQAKPKQVLVFTIKFLSIGYVAFCIGFGLYFALLASRWFT